MWRNLFQKKQHSVKILSGWSKPGGSTTAFINLTNLLNENEVDCTYYGPHSFHLDKCKASKLEEYTIVQKDRVIYHFLDIFDKRPSVAKFILSLHETQLYPLKQYDYTLFDTIHYVSEYQKKWHDVDHPHFICPNVVEPLNTTCKPPTGRIGGVIGSIDPNKNVHVSIRRALASGMDKVLVYGVISDQRYFEKSVAPLIDNETVQFCGYQMDKQKMYDQLTDVFQDSKSETWGYIQRECDLTGVRYHGCGTVEQNHTLALTNKQIFDIWAKKLKL